MYFIVIAGIGLLLFYYLPNLLTSNTNLTYESGTLRNVYLDTYRAKRIKGYGYVEKSRLVLETIDRTKKKYYLTSDFEKYWGAFQDSNALDKYMKVRLDIENSRTDPIEIRLDNKVIYGKLDWAKSNWLFFVVFCGIIGIIGYQFYLKNTHNQNYN